MAQVGAGMIMITGSGPGAGKSALLTGLTRSLGEVTVFAIDEDAVWGSRQLDESPVDHGSAWPEFHRLLHEHNALETTSAADVLTTFATFRERALARDEILVQDWSWLDLAKHWPWGRTDAQLVGFSRELRLAAAPLRPVVLYLAIDPALALDRAARARGTTWFSRHVHNDPHAPADIARVQALAESYREREVRRRRLLQLGGWHPRFLDATATEPRVLDAALAAVASVM